MLCNKVYADGPLKSFGFIELGQYRRFFSFTIKYKTVKSEVCLTLLCNEKRLQDFCRPHRTFDNCSLNTYYLRIYDVNERSSKIK